MQGGRTPRFVLLGDPVPILQYPSLHPHWKILAMGPDNHIAQLQKTNYKGTNLKSSLDNKHKKSSKKNLKKCSPYVLPF